MAYVLEDQVGFLLRQAHQRHANLFAAMMVDGLTPTQWAALSKLAETGASSQNQLGRLTSMDGATVKGVIDRLCARGLTATRADPEDGRRLLVELTEAGAALYLRAAPVAAEITVKTLEAVPEGERERFVEMLRRLA